MHEISTHYKKLAEILQADGATAQAGVETYLRLAALYESFANEMAEQEKLGRRTIPIQRYHAILSDLSGRLASSTDAGAAIDEILHATINLHNADFGNVQVLDRSTGTLKIVAHHNFKDDFLAVFCEVAVLDDSACGRAFRNGAQVVIEDVMTEPSYEPFRGIARAAGYRSVQSTPIFGHSGEVLGMISTHFADARAPSTHDMKMAELCATHLSHFVSQVADRRHSNRLERA